MCVCAIRVDLQWVRPAGTTRVGGRAGGWPAAARLVLVVLVIVRLTYGLLRALVIAIRRKDCAGPDSTRKCPFPPLSPEEDPAPCWGLVGPCGGPAAAAHRRLPRPEPEGTVPLGPGHILVPLTHGLGNWPRHSLWPSTGYRSAISPHRRNRETHRMSERSSSYRPWQAH